MKTKKKTPLPGGYFTKTEIALWGLSCAVILASALLFRAEPLPVAASFLGVTSLVFNAKGNPAGQALMIVFSLLYGWISWETRYYGEMLTYLGMTGPMAAAALVSWLRHPWQGRRSEVEVRRVGGGEFALILALTAAVTAVFGVLLARLGTANLAWSTVSVATSFLAVALTFRRSAAYALAYAANDAVLIVLWTLAARTEPGAPAVVVCFAAFLAGDLYGYANWRRMRRRQGGQYKSHAKSSI